MPHEISPDNHHTAGEYRLWEYTIERNGSAKNLENAEVEWYLVPRQGDPDSEAVHDSHEDNVSATITDPLNGKVEVEIGSGVTKDVGGRNLWQRLIVIDDVDVDGEEQKESIWNGDFPIQKR